MIYVASSWRNIYQPDMVKRLREAGHEVYDFRNPKEGDKGFHWGEIDPEWQSWTTAEYAAGLEHPVAQAGFKSDMDALKACDAVVLLLPCGRSAHLEAGWAAGAGKDVYIYIPKTEAPELELMNIMCRDITDDTDELLMWLKSFETVEEAAQCACGGSPINVQAGYYQYWIRCAVCERAGPKHELERDARRAWNKMQHV